MRLGKRQLARDVGVQLQQQVPVGGTHPVQLPRAIYWRDTDPELLFRPLPAAADKRGLAVGGREIGRKVCCPYDTEECDVCA